MKNNGVLLDSTAKDLEVQIYEVDGIRGTLKELSDYFNVDPISVSDCMLEGMSIQDALCVAKPGFKPKEKENKKEMKMRKSKRGKHKRGGALAKLKNKKQVIIDEYYNTDANYNTLAAKYGVSTWMIGEVLREYKKNNAGKVPKKDFHFGRPVKMDTNSVAANPAVNAVDKKCKLLSISSVSDTQDTGDLLVITTTTTVVYRKG